MYVYTSIYIYMSTYAYIFIGKSDTQAHNGLSRSCLAASGVRRHPPALSTPPPFPTCLAPSTPESRDTNAL